MGVARSPERAAGAAAKVFVDVQVKRRMPPWWSGLVALIQAWNAIDGSSAVVWVVVLSDATLASLASQASRARWPPRAKCSLESLADQTGKSPPKRLATRVAFSVVKVKAVLAGLPVKALRSQVETWCGSRGQECGQPKPRSPSRDAQLDGDGGLSRGLSLSSGRRISGSEPASAPRSSS